MKLKKVIVSALCCSLCFGTVFYTSGCSKMKAEKERIAAEQAAEAKRLAEAEAKAKAQAEEEARKAAEKAAEDAERERRVNELSSMSLEEIIENNDLHFIVDNNVEIYKENNRWYCTFSGRSRRPVYLTHEIKDDVLDVYYSNENGDISYKEIENGYDFNYPTYIDYQYFQTKKFSIKKSELIEYLVTKNYKLPEVVDCDTYDDSIQYFNPVNNITAVVVADYASVKDAPRGVGDIQTVAEFNQWDEVRLLGRTDLSASLDGTKEEPFYLINVKNEKGEIVPGWIHGSLIKIFRSNSDLERLKLHFSEADTPVLVPGIEYSGKKVPVQGNVLSYYGYDDNNPVINSIESFLNYYTDSELENVKEFHLEFAKPEGGALNPALGDVGYGELPSLQGIERIPNLEKLYFGDSVHLKSLKGIENLKKLKKLVVHYESLSDEDKTFLEPLKTDKVGTYYLNGYKGEDEKEGELSKDMSDFLWEYKNSVWISDFDGYKKERVLSFGTVSLPDSCHYFIFENVNNINYIYYGFAEGGHVFDHYAARVNDVKKVSDGVFEIFVNSATNMSDLVSKYFIDNINNAIFSDTTEVITVSTKDLGTEKGISLKCDSFDITSKDFYKYDKSKMDNNYYNSFVKDDNVYVRAGTSGEDKIMSVINKGEKIHIISKSDKTSVVHDVEDFWYNVELRNGIKGWIFGAYISILEEKDIAVDSEIVN